MRRLLAWTLFVSACAAGAAQGQTPLTTLAGRGGDGACPSFDIPPGGSTFFVDPVKGPIGVGVDRQGRLFVAMGSNCIFRLDADGLLRVGFPDSSPFRIGMGTPGFSDGGAAGAALIRNPQHLTIDPAGNLYFADASNQRIRKVNTSTWTISTVAGGGSLRPNDGIQATDASFLFPTSVAVDSHGNLFIVDSNAAKVFRVDTAGVLTRFAGSGGFTYNGEGIPATSAGMIPMDVEVDPSGNVLIADWSNSIIRKVTPDGLITSVAGNPFNVTGLGDGGPAAFGGVLAKPRGISVDGAGDLFIADTEHHRIRMVDTAGTITTVAGDGTPGNTDAQLNFPYDIAVDDPGNLFIADSVNNELRGLIVSPRTYALTLATTGTGSGSVVGGGTYAVGQVIPVSAAAAAGSTFAGWSGPNAAACASGAVVINLDKACTARFDAAADTTPPVLSNVPAPIVVNGAPPAGATVTYALPTATDPDDAAGPVVCTPPAGSLFPAGTTLVTCSSTDTHGNTGTASFTVTVNTGPLAISIAETITVADDDIIVPAIALLISESVTVTDSEDLTLSDITAPTLTVPAPRTVEATGPAGAVVVFTLPTATDPDDAAGRRRLQQPSAERPGQDYVHPSAEYQADRSCHQRTVIRDICRRLASRTDRQRRGAHRARRRQSVDARSEPVRWLPAGCACRDASGAGARGPHQSRTGATGAAAATARRSGCVSAGALHQ